MAHSLKVEEKFSQICFSLSEEDIYELNKSDNGSLNNVISKIAKHCYGVAVYEETDKLSVHMFYVTNFQKLQGDIICLDLHDLDYFQLLLMFCNLLATDYKDVDAINSFNTFQNYLRTYLEKSEYFTVTNIELKKFKEQEITMLSPYPIKIVQFIDKVDFYRQYFKNNYIIVDSKNSTYVYLMVNVDTSLIKIGFSNNPYYRERTLHSQEPDIHLIACWESNMDKERELHKKFEKKRIRGEWFRLNLKDLHEIEKFMS